MIIRKTTKDILVESFRELAGREKIKKITIKDITDNCGMSPATFYRHFKDKYDLIAWDYAKRVGEIMAHSSAEGSTWRQVLLEFMQFYYGQKDFFIKILCHTSGYYSFIRNMTEVSVAEIEAYVKRKSNQETLAKETALYNRFYCFGAVQLVCGWMTGTIGAEPEEIADVLVKTVPSTLAEFFK